MRTDAPLPHLGCPPRRLPVKLGLKRRSIDTVERTQVMAAVDVQAAAAAEAWARCQFQGRSSSSLEVG